MRTKELEVQYNIGRYEEEKKKASYESSQIHKLREEAATFSKTETELRNQLNVYVDKFKQVSAIMWPHKLSYDRTWLIEQLFPQVEDTLNNSNDLFMTFRREMEDMSKKTKKLEKENEQLKKKHGELNANIVKMADERTKNLKAVDEAKLREEKLKSIITQMQQQGRGIPASTTTMDNGYVGEGGEEVDDVESDYEYEDDEEEDLSDEAEYGDDDADLTEDEHHQAHPNASTKGNAAAVEAAPKPFGPVPPPPPPSSTVTTNGH